MRCRGKKLAACLGPCRYHKKRCQSKHSCCGGQCSPHHHSRKKCERFAKYHHRPNSKKDARCYPKTKKKPPNNSSGPPNASSGGRRNHDDAKMIPANNADTKRYRAGYPGHKDDPHANLNYKFYSGAMTIPGYKLTIDGIHEQWHGNWKLLEWKHDYIQWLFPIREISTFNGNSQALQLHEAKKIKKDPECKLRVQKSWELMLDFYGMTLVNAGTGALQRHDRYKPCYKNLNESGHNSLRITRMLKCLGELGFEHYKKPFIMHILKEIYENGELGRTRNSCINYWAAVLRKDSDLNDVEAYLHLQACS